MLKCFLQCDKFVHRYSTLNIHLESVTDFFVDNLIYNVLLRISREQSFIYQYRRFVCCVSVIYCAGARTVNVDIFTKNSIYTVGFKQVRQGTLILRKRSCCRLKRNTFRFHTRVEIVDYSRFLSVKIFPLSFALNTLKCLNSVKFALFARQPHCHCFGKIGFAECLIYLKYYSRGFRRGFFVLS